MGCFFVAGFAVCDVEYCALRGDFVEFAVWCLLEVAVVGFQYFLDRFEFGDAVCGCKFDDFALIAVGETLGLSGI